MKKTVYIILTGIIIGFSACKKQDSIYEEYIVPNGLSYPAKAMDAIARPGKERIEISWKNGNDPKVVKARISWNNETEGVEVNVSPGVDSISRMIEPLEENTYSFMIRTYDADGNVSIPVEVIGEVYGELYENSLVNRPMKNALFDADESCLYIEWSDADPTEIGIDLDYTDINGDSRTLRIDNTETTSVIPDFKVGEPAFCTTLYKPDSMAIDIFNTTTVRVPYEAKVLTDVLKNAEMPFTTEGTANSFGLYTITDWTVTDNLAANGIVYPDFGGGSLSIISWAGYTSPTVTNAKIFQTVELEEGVYRFAVFGYSDYEPGATVNYRANIAAALGDDLPDSDDIGREALGYATILPPMRGVEYFFEFTLTEKSNVSLGFVITTTGNTEMYFGKVELWKTTKY